MVLETRCLRQVEAMSWCNKTAAFYVRARAKASRVSLPQKRPSHASGKLQNHSCESCTRVQCRELRVVRVKYSSCTEGPRQHLPCSERIPLRSGGANEIAESWLHAAGRFGRRVDAVRQVGRAFLWLWLCGLEGGDCSQLRAFYQTVFWMLVIATLMFSTVDEAE
jgi:hypothetical protein